jgi:hypothetical protein
VGSRENVLSFKKDDLIQIIDQTRQDWWRGVLRGRTGAVPASYVRPHGDQVAKTSDAEERRGRRSTIVAAPDVAAKMRAAAEQQKNSKMGTALYPFLQQKPGVLNFKKGDRLTILDSSRNDWWKAELNGKLGMVPAKYIQLAVASPKPPVKGKCLRFVLFFFSSFLQRRLNLFPPDRNWWRCSCSKVLVRTFSDWSQEWRWCCWESLLRTGGKWNVEAESGWCRQRLYSP